MILESLPPHDIPAEEAVLATMLVDEGFLAKVEWLKPGDFFRERNGLVLWAGLELAKRGEAVNEITVAHELAVAGHLEAVGGLSELSRMVAELPTTVGAEWYARIVWRCARFRDLISAASQIARWGYEAGPDFEAVREKAYWLLREIGE